MVMRMPFFLPGNINGRVNNGNKGKSIMGNFLIIYENQCKAVVRYLTINDNRGKELVQGGDPTNIW